MIDKLPPEFINRMRVRLGGEWEAFAAEYALSPWQGLRANRLKVNPSALKDMLPFKLSPVRWCPDGFTFPSGERPAKLIEYHAGLYYIQEPSAMLPAEVLNARPGDRVLDICAAPGGKSVQLAGKLLGEGILVANDVSASRGRALVKNLELAGAANAIIMNEQPARLAARFAGFFDKILVDAPCSGEGMFRRDIDAVKSWAANKPDACAALQREILKHAAVMLRPGGRMVYSTCTFSEIENENLIVEFLKANRDFSLLPIDCGALGVSAADIFKWPTKDLTEGFSRASRIWPHKAYGEGHFAALLQKHGGEGECSTDNASDEGKIFSEGGRSAKRKMAEKTLPPPDVFINFCKESFQPQAAEFLLAGNFAVNGVSLYRVPNGLPDLRGLRFARSGWYMGDISKGRFTPSQALAMGLTLNNARIFVDLQPGEAQRYLRGETITPQGVSAPEGKPWALVGSAGYPLGWARWVNGRLKNYLPAGWVEN